jgi:hypothetical protein
VGRCGRDPSGSRQGPVAGSCEQGYEPSSSIKFGNFFEQLSECRKGVWQSYRGLYGFLHSLQANFELM